LEQLWKIQTRSRDLDLAILQALGPKPDPFSRKYFVQTTVM
jgi:hypothetical protein